MKPSNPSPRPTDDDKKWIRLFGIAVYAMMYLSLVGIVVLVVTVITNDHGWATASVITGVVLVLLLVFAAYCDHKIQGPARRDPRRRRPDKSHGE